MTQTTPPKSAGEMMFDIMGNVGSLVRNEVDLARTEITTSLVRAAGALGAMLVAFALAMVGLNLLAAWLVALAIRAGVPAQWAEALVGAAVLLIAYMTFLFAKSALNQIGFMPTRTARNVQRDAAAIKEAYNDK